LLNLRCVITFFAQSCESQPQSLPRGTKGDAGKLLAHPEQGRRTWAEETNSLRPASAIMTSACRFSQSKLARNALFSSALRPEENVCWFRVIRLIRLMPGI
jgi:hypothetical protein